MIRILDDRRIINNCTTPLVEETALILERVACSLSFKEAIDSSNEGSPSVWLGGGAAGAPSL
eukprot:4983572-Pyramimonas_sp.AAC.1